MTNFPQLLFVQGLALFSFVKGAGSPGVGNWSSSTYGPDGPWHAITALVGSNYQAIDLIPGGTYASSIFSTSACPDEDDYCPARKGGLYTKSSDASFGISWSPQPGFGKPLQTNGSSESFRDSFRYYTGGDFYNSSLSLMSEAYHTLPNGTQYPITLGTMSLGAPSRNQTFSGSGVSSSVYANFPIIEMFAAQLIPSASMAFHIGGTSAEIPPSLTYGGYDQNRALGSVITRPNDPKGGADLPPFFISLLDISIGNAEGGSPFPYATRGGLLQGAVASTGGGSSSSSGSTPSSRSVSVSIDSLNPYLSLPPATCAAITQDLPVRLDEGLGLYLWNTKDPRYTQIVNSASYLSFTFSMSSSTPTNVSINVPWKLLNLTLESPILSAPTPYFPCNPYGGPIQGLYQYTLGRAFLQAAYFGVNWRPFSSNGYWFLAQAPGPGGQMVSATQYLQNDDPTIQSSGLAWVSTWRGYWTPLPISPQSPAATSPSASSGMSSGAKAGAGTGAAIGGLVILAGAIFAWRKRRDSKNVTNMNDPKDPPPEYKRDEGFIPLETYGKTSPDGPREMEAPEPDHELQGSIEPRIEMPA